MTNPTALTDAEADFMEWMDSLDLEAVNLLDENQKPTEDGWQSPAPDSSKPNAKK